MKEIRIQTEFFL